jgi:hypothetical protein
MSTLDRPGSNVITKALTTESQEGRQRRCDNERKELWAKGHRQPVKPLEPPASRRYLVLCTSILVQWDFWLPELEVNALVSLFTPFPHWGVSLMQPLPQSFLEHVHHPKRKRPICPAPPPLHLLTIPGYTCNHLPTLWLYRINLEFWTC